MLSGEQAPVDELTTVGQLMGTLDYMAPEQLEDSHLVGPRADIYALAATLFRLLTGAAPFANENRKTPLQKLRALATQTAPSIRERRADLPVELAAIIDRALRRDPAERFATMTEFAEALTPWCAGHDLSQLVGHVSNVPAPAVQLPSLRQQPRSHVRQNVGESSISPRSGERGYERTATPNTRSGQVENRPHEPPRRRSGIVALLALVGLVALGVVITIETNKGTLIVESVRDGVEVRVKKSGRAVQQLEVSKTTKSTKLAAGEYEIELVGEADGLQINQHKIVVTRGDVVVAKIVEVPMVTSHASGEAPSKGVARSTAVAELDVRRSEGDIIESEEDAAVRRKLTNSIDLEFTDTPLTDTLPVIAKKLGVEVRLDAESLNEYSIPSDVLVTFKIANGSGEKLLAKMLAPLNLAYEVRDGVLVIIPSDRADVLFTTRFYNVRDVLDRGLSSQRLIRAVQDDTNGPWLSRDDEGGTIELLTDELLIIRQTAMNHAQIATFLMRLRQQLSQQSARSTPADLDALVSKLGNAGPDDERPNPTAKSIDESLAESSEHQSEAKYREAMRRECEMMFEDQPLTDVIEFWRDGTGQPIWLDASALAEDGLATDIPVTITLKGVSQATAMLLTLRPLQLTSYWDGSSIVITTVSKAKEKLVNRSYPVGRSLPMVRQAVRRLKAKDNEQREALKKAGVTPQPVDRGGGGFFAVPTDVGWDSVPTNFRTGRDGIPTYDLQLDPSALEDRLHFQFGVGFGGAGMTPSHDGYGIPMQRSVADYYAHLLELLTDAQWSASDGEGGTVSMLGDVLFVRQTRPAHEQVEAALRLLEQAAVGSLKNSPVELRRRDYPFEADRRLLGKMSMPTKVQFQDGILQDALHYLEDYASITILVDKEKLHEEGIAIDSSVNVSLTNQPLNVVLRRILDPLQLTVNIEEGLLFVTTQSAVKERLVTRVYEVRELLSRGIDGDDLIASLETGTTGPWLNIEGEGGELQVFADRLLYVTQTRTMHDEVAAFLRDLDAKLGKQPAKKPGSVKPKPVAQAAGGFGGPSTTPAADPNPPRYDGKTFDEWLAILDTERSPAKLTEAIEALRLLGRDTHAEQIAERVLMASRVVDFDQGTGSQRPLLGATIRLFWNLPDELTERAFAKELRNGTTRSRLFLLGSMPREKLASQDYVQAVLSTCRDNDSNVRERAVSELIRLPLKDKFARFAEERTKQLRASLNDAEPQVAYLAAVELLDSESDSAAVAQALFRAYEKPKYGQQKLEVLNRLAIMGPRAASVASQVAALLQRDEESKGEDHNIADDWIRRFHSGDMRSRQLIAAVALARMGKAAADVLPKIDETRRVSFGGYEDRNGVSLDEHVQWPDLLLIVRNRIEPQQAFDLRGGDLNHIESALRLVAWNYKLLQMEQALLQQYRGKNHPSVKDLAVHVETMARTFAVVKDLTHLRQFIDTVPHKTPQELAATLTASLTENSFRSDTPTNLPNGLTILADSPRVTAIQELGKLGAAARDALPTLKKELESKDETVVKAAKQAIEQIETAKPDGESK